MPKVDVCEQPPGTDTVRRAVLTAQRKGVGCPSFRFLPVMQLAPSAGVAWPSLHCPVLFGAQVTPVQENVDILAPPAASRKRLCCGAGNLGALFPSFPYAFISLGPD